MANHFVIVALVLGISLCAASALEFSGRKVTNTADMEQLMNEYEEGSGADHDRYLSSVRFLQVVLSVGNENVCSDEKISVLEEFNKRFISTTSRDKENRKEDDSVAPEPVKEFFMHYANKISTICKKSLLDMVALAPSMFVDQDGKPAEVEPIDKIIQRFLGTFNLNPAKNGYRDLILPWKLADSFSYKGYAKKFLHDVQIDDGASHNRISSRISVKANGGKNFETIRKSCIKNMKPTYSKLALPVLRLINLGMYQSNEALEQALATNEDLVRLFGVTQFCETMLPVEVFQDDSLPDGKIVVISSKRAAELRALQPLIHLTDAQSDEEAPAYLAFEKTEVIETLVDTQVEQLIIKAIKANRNDQEKVFDRIVKFGQGLIKSYKKTQFGGSMTIVVPGNNDVLTDVDVEADKESQAATRRKRGLPLLIGFFIIGSSILLSFAIMSIIPYILKGITHVLVLAFWAATWPFVWLIDRCHNDANDIDIDSNLPMNQLSQSNLT